MARGVVGMAFCSINAVEATRALHLHGFAASPGVYQEWLLLSNAVLHTSQEAPCIMSSILVRTAVTGTGSGRMVGGNAMLWPPKHVNMGTIGLSAHTSHALMPLLSSLPALEACTPYGPSHAFLGT